MHDNRTDYSLSLWEANGISLLIMIPAAALFCVVYGGFWGWEKMAADISLIFINYEYLLLAVIPGILLHELLHAWGWMAASGLGWESMSFGLNLKALAPYAHCNQPMRVEAYRQGVAAPGVLLGLLPLCWGLIFGSALPAGFGFLFTLVATGDFLMLWILKDISPEKLVEDHPTRVGCLIAEGNGAPG